MAEQCDRPHLTALQENPGKPVAPNPVAISIVPETAANSGHQWTRFGKHAAVGDHGMVDDTAQVAAAALADFTFAATSAFAVTADIAGALRGPMQRHKVSRRGGGHQQTPKKDWVSQVKTLR